MKKFEYTFVIDEKYFFIIRQDNLHVAELIAAKKTRMRSGFPRKLPQLFLVNKVSELKKYTPDKKVEAKPITGQKYIGDVSWLDQFHR